MKKKFCSYTATCLLLFISCASFSQQPPWVSDKGYWVVVDQRHEPKQHSVRFYNNDNVLIGTKEISGQRLNLKKEKAKMQMKALLESVVLAWEKKRDSVNAPGFVKKQ